MKVLLVGAELDLVELLEYALSRRGYTVVTALDGDQALRKWEAEHPDLVLLDVDRSRLDSLEISRRIRELARTPIVLLSERAGEADILAGFAAGADDFVPKPFTTRQLFARMQAVLRGYEADPADSPGPQP